MKFFYKIIGQTEYKGKFTFYKLGFTTSKKEATNFYTANGWKKEDLIFMKQEVQFNYKQRYLNK